MSEQIWYFCRTRWAEISELQLFSSDCCAGGGGGRADRKALWAGHSCCHPAKVFIAGEDDPPPTSAPASFRARLFGKGELR